MNKKTNHHEGIRDNLRVALSTISNSRSSNSSGSDAGCILKTSNKNVAFDDETGQLIDKESYAVRESRRHGSSKSPIPDWVFDYSSYSTAAKQAPVGSSQWLHFAYGERQSWNSTVKMIEVAYGQFDFNNEKKLKPDTVKIIKALVLLAAQCVKHEVNTGKALKTQSEVAKLANINSKNWEKHWSKRWKLLRQIFFNMDILGLDFVEQKTRTKKRKVA